jgi:inorganic pyrophosphatase
VKTRVPFVALCAPFLCFNSVPHRAIVGDAPVAVEATALDDETIVGPAHYVRGYPPRNLDDSVNAVVEIPAGTTAKFEVDETSGVLRWQKKREDGSRRAIDFLPYPANYGMVPRTLSADGDPLDVLVLGRGIERGHVAATRIIGVLMMAQDGVRDDKLIAVPLEPALHNGFSELRDLDELDDRYPAARELLDTWFSFYWGPGATEVIGWGDAHEANVILDEAIDAATGLRRPAPECIARPGSSAPRLRASLRFVPRVRDSHALARRPARD